MKRIFASALLLSVMGVACNGNQTPHTVVTNPTPGPTAISGPIGPICPAWGCNGPEPIHPVPFVGSAAGSAAESVGADTKDVDLERAQLQQDSFNQRVEENANQFQMSQSSATQLTQLSDQLGQLTASGASAEDRAAVTHAALDAAGITGDELNYAIAQNLKGDATATEDLLNKAAGNLGMPTSALRDKLLPSLGISTR